MIWKVNPMEGHSPLIRISIHHQPLIRTIIIFFTHIQALPITVYGEKIWPATSSLYHCGITISTISCTIEILGAKLKILKIGMDFQFIIFVIGWQNRLRVFSAPHNFDRFRHYFVYDNAFWINPILLWLFIDVPLFECIIHEWIFLYFLVVPSLIFLYNLRKFNFLLKKLIQQDFHRELCF